MQKMFLKLGLGETDIGLSEVKENSFFESDSKIYYKADDGVIYPVGEQNVNFNIPIGNEQALDPLLPVPKLAASGFCSFSSDPYAISRLKLTFGFDPKYDGNNLLKNNLPDNYTFGIEMSTNPNKFTNEFTTNSFLRMRGRGDFFIDTALMDSTEDLGLKLNEYRILKQFGLEGLKPFSHLSASVDFLPGTMLGSLLPSEFIQKDSIYIRAFIFDRISKSKSLYSNTVQVQNVEKIGIYPFFDGKR